MVKEDQTVTVRWVKLGPSEGDSISIEEGLSPGEIVVVEGAEKLREGSKVDVQKQSPDSSTKGNG
jgi:multidrug efflux system membrane fusion protein